MKILYFDTETTGIVDWRAGLDAPHQPRLVQLACVLTDGQSGNEISLVKVRVRPDGFDIPEGASKVHGITTALARQTGISAAGALNIFAALVDAADCLVAYNAEFDKFIIEREDFLSPGEKSCDWFNKPVFCAMKPMTDVCQIPNPNYPGKFKWPKLQEAHVHLFKEPFDGAHDALADVRATARVWHWLVSNGKVKKP